MKTRKDNKISAQGQEVMDTIIASGGKFQVVDVLDSKNKAIDFTLNKNKVETEYRGSMNVRKWGPTCIFLYSKDIFSNKTVAKIPYDTIVYKEKFADQTEQILSVPSETPSLGMVEE